MLIFIFLCLALSNENTEINNKANLGDIPDDETYLILSLAFISFLLSLLVFNSQ